MSSPLSLPTLGNSALAALRATSAPARQWVAVADRFRQFHLNVLLTGPQLSDGRTKFAGVVRSLNAHYYGASSETDNAFFVGAWGKTTMTRPPRDVDIFFVLPASVHTRFQSYVWNRQSALLQEVKEVLAETYSTTELRGDGQVVCVNFTSYNVEVVPAFLLTDGRYWICDTNEGGRYKVADPFAEAAKIEAVDAFCSGNLRPLICMLKAWQAECSVPLDSFVLELLTAEFLAQSAWRNQTYFWYDWLLRDFFAFLCARASGFVTLPGPFQLIYLGDDWKSRAQTAYKRAVDACEYERENYVHLAGQEWQKIFGTQIPVAP